MSRKPHARLANKHWRDDEVYTGFLEDWAQTRKLYGVTWARLAWTPQDNELNWQCILRWRARDAFATADIPREARAAFEAILLSDVAGEALPLAYAYADQVKASWYG